MPLLVVITGHPCTGKTALGAQLATHYNLPLFAKDQFKELLYDTVAEGQVERISLELSRTFSRASIGCLELVVAELLDKQISSVMEANFDAALFSPRLTQLQQRHSFHLVQVLLRADPAVLVDRFVVREATDRHPGHQGLKHLAVMKEAIYTREQQPLQVEGDLVIVDTTDWATVNYAPVFSMVKQRLAEQATT